MNQKILEKILTWCQDSKNLPIGKNKHFSFIIKRNNILSIGINNYGKTHPRSKCWSNIHSDRMHSELDAYLNLRWRDVDFTKTELINIRINKYNDLGMAKPCQKCQELIQKLGFKKVWYTDYNGVVQELESYNV